MENRAPLRSLSGQGGEPGTWRKVIKKEKPEELPDSGDMVVKESVVGGKEGGRKVLRRRKESVEGGKVVSGGYRVYEGEKGPVLVEDEPKEEVGFSKQERQVAALKAEAAMKVDNSESTRSGSIGGGGRPGRAGRKRL